MKVLEISLGNSVNSGSLTPNLFKSKSKSVIRLLAFTIHVGIEIINSMQGVHI